MAFRLTWAWLWELAMAATKDKATQIESKNCSNQPEGVELFRLCIGGSISSIITKHGSFRLLELLGYGFLLLLLLSFFSSL